MTTERMLEAVIAEVDVAWARMRECIVEPDHINPDSKRAREAREELACAIDRSFRIKDAIYTARQLARNQP